MNFTYRKLIGVLPIALCLIVGGCGDIDEEKQESSEKESVQDGPYNKKDMNLRCEDSAFSDAYKKAAVKGRFFDRSKGVGQTEQNLGTEDPESNKLEGIGGKKVGLILEGEAEEQVVKTCPDGRFYFDVSSSETPKVGLFQFYDGNCTTTNCPTNFGKLAAAKKTIKVVTFGDSIGDNPSKKVTFPIRLKELAAPVADIDNVNVSKGGTKTYEWVPGQKLFEERIAKNNNDADVYIFSLGGNNILLDMMSTFVFTPTWKIDEALEKKKKDLESGFNEIRTIIDKLREYSPNADIVWVSYMDYSTSNKFLKLLANPYKQNAVRRFIHEGFVKQREMISGYKDTMVVDMFELSQKPDRDGSKFDINARLRGDTIHYTPKGHYFLASQVFRVLGGMFLGEKLVGPDVEKKPEETFDMSDFGNIKYIGYSLNYII